MIKPLQIVALAAAFIALPAHAEGDEQEIVVKGAPVLEEKQAVNHVAQITRATGGQVARYHNPICPAAMGLSPQNSAILMRRIRAMAQSIGAEVDPKPRCQANLILMIAADADALFEDARKRKLSWFEGVRAADISKLAASDGPVKVWHVTSMRNEDGHGSGVYGEDMDGVTLQVRSVSMLRKPTRQDIDGSVLIIERSAIEGLSLNQIAAYALMRTAARTDIPDAPHAGTILTLFTPDGDRPAGLTPADETYLKALYSGDGRLRETAEITRIAAQLSKP